MAMKISSKELEMKAWQLINDRVMINVVTLMVIRLWNHEYAATPI
jgi:hypothetical protein